MLLNLLGHLTKEHLLLQILDGDITHLLPHVGYIVDGSAAISSPAGVLREQFSGALLVGLGISFNEVCFELLPNGFSGAGVVEVDVQGGDKQLFLPLQI